MMKPKLLPAIGLLAMLSACGSLTGDPSKDLPNLGSQIGTADAVAQQSVATLAKFTVEDLQAADADAQANFDLAAHSCYAALIPVVQARTDPKTTVVGAVSAFQHSRDIVKLIRGQGAIAQACAALKQDVTGDVLGLGTLFGIP